MQRFTLSRLITPFLLGACSCLLAHLLLTTSHGGCAEETSDRSIDDLIADLGSSRFEIREAATRTLKERVEAIPALRKVQRRADLEVRRRVEVILIALERKRALRSLSRAQALGKAGRVVEVADCLAFAAKHGVGGDEGWESLTQFAEQMIAKTGRHFSPGSKSYWKRELPVGEFHRFVKRVHPKEIAESKIEIDTGKDHDPRDAKMRAAHMFIREHQGEFLLRGEEVSLIGKTPLFALCNGVIASSVYWFSENRNFAFERVAKF